MSGEILHDDEAFLVKWKPNSQKYPYVMFEVTDPDTGETAGYDFIASDADQLEKLANALMIGAKKLRGD